MMPSMICCSLSYHLLDWPQCPHPRFAFSSSCSGFRRFPQCSREWKQFLKSGRIDGWNDNLNKILQTLTIPTEINGRGPFEPSLTVRAPLHILDCIDHGLGSHLLVGKKNVPVLNDLLKTRSELTWSTYNITANGNERQSGQCFWCLLAFLLKNLVCQSVWENIPCIYRHNHAECDSIRWFTVRLIKMATTFFLILYNLNSTNQIVIYEHLKEQQKINNLPPVPSN